MAALTRADACCHVLRGASTYRHVTVPFSSVLARSRPHLREARRAHREGRDAKESRHAKARTDERASAQEGSGSPAICVDVYDFELRCQSRCPPEVVNLVNLWEGG